jgi:GNAT superfamily N-acetyltransferase/predicted nucleic acid-binding protein
MLQVKSSWTDVEGFLEITRANADRARNELGFLPPIAYEQAARLGNLYVATDDSTYSGHLLFGGPFPRAKIFQLYVSEAYRGKGVATLLLRKLEIELEKKGFLTISAAVATDLKANSFWEKSGFPVLRQREGGVSRGRKINVRVKDLNTPNLFNPEQQNDALNLNMTPPYVMPIPDYVLDLNVFWDVLKDRPRSDYARQVIGAALDNFIHVVVTSEFLNELKRKTRTGQSDPALEFALQLPALRMPPDGVLSEITTDLTGVIFPNKQAGKLSPQDRSDLVHLATAIHHRAVGFLTSDEAIVARASQISAKYGLEIFHISQFSAALHSHHREISPLQARVSGETLILWELVSKNSEIFDSFLDLIGADELQRHAVLGEEPSNRHIKRVAITSDGDVVCVAYWDPRGPLQGCCSLTVLTNEDHPAAETALDCLLSRIAAEVSKHSPVIIELNLPPGSALAKKVGFAHGFRRIGTPLQNRLSKVCVGRPISKENLKDMTSIIKQLSGLNLSPTLPDFSNHHQVLLVIDALGLQRRVELLDLETVLSPSLFLLPKRAAAIVPIQRSYAEQLFGTSAQMNLHPGKEAILFSERVYLSSSRNLNTLSEGTILFFYESGGNRGRAAIFAAARSLGTTLVGKNHVPITILRRGVIENNDLNELTVDEKIAVTRFDNVMLFPRDVSLFSLRMIGCVDRSNLVTARRITGEQTAAIVREAYTS